MPEQYLKRSSFHAHRLVRLLNKSCTANEIGIDACWLITTIAFTEDSTRYSKPVTFWTAQLLAVTGFRSWDTMNRARQRAIDAGWLHYEAGTKTTAAKYWTLTPAAISKNFDDSPLVESDLDPQISDESKEQSHMDPQISDECADQSLIKARSKRGYSIPNPNPEEEGVQETPAASVSASKRADYPQHFEAIWDAYPKQRRKGKKDTFTAYKKAVERMAKVKGGEVEARSFLLTQVQRFAASFKGQNFSPAPKLWFADECYEQSLEDWQPFGQAASDDDWPEVHSIVHETFHPDLRNDSDVAAKLTADQFTAAKSVGLRRIADANSFDKETPAAYRKARQGASL